MGKRYLQSLELIIRMWSPTAKPTTVEGEIP